MKRYFFFLVVCLCLMAGCREFQQGALDSFSMGNGEENSVLAESDGEGRIAPVAAEQPAFMSKKRSVLRMSFNNTKWKLFL